MSNKKWTIISLSVFLILLLGLGAVTVVIDPFFHYHAPLEQCQYPLNNERYQNNGIVRHFTYDAIITGTSMTENFKTSELDALFGVNSIKVPFSGGSYREINENLDSAIQSNPDIKYIIRGLDYDYLLRDKDRKEYESYPTYLYDELLWNDVYYIFNKEILFGNTLQVISYTHNGYRTTSFDSYANWMSGNIFGKEAVDKTYSRRVKKAEHLDFTIEDQLQLEGNLSQNITELIGANPDITFYLFFTPYSIYYWDSLKQAGSLDRQLEAEKRAIEFLLPYSNIKLFSFFDEFELITDLAKYKDTVHYSEEVNSQILRWMHNGEHQLTRDNYQAYCDKTREFYSSFDYDSLFE